MPAVTFANLWYLTIFLVLTSGALSCSQATSGGSGGYYLLDAEGDGSTVSGADTPGGSDTVAPSDTAAPPDIYTGDPTYDGPACTTSAACKDYGSKNLCATAIKQCVECLTEYQCQPGQTCDNFACKDPSCTPGATSCDGPFLLTCNEDGKTSTSSKCPDATPTCVAGQCRVCEPGSKYCEAASTGSKSKAVMQCNADGSNAVVLQACEGDATCINKQCMVCAPGTKQCNGSLAMACNNDGSGMDIADDCGAKGQACQGGLCVSPCQGDLKSNTYVGCDFWAVDLDNIVEGDLDAQNQQYGVVVSNTADGPAAVTVSIGTKGQAGYHSKTYTVAAKGLQSINLPDPSWGLPPQNQEGTSINSLLYRIQADQPIVAYQFNPMTNVGVFSNDASLLLPSNALGKTYYVMSHAELDGPYRSFANIIATAPGTTTVSVKPTCKTLAGSAVPSIGKGKVGTVQLQQGQALNLESDEKNGDMTGTYIEADKPVAVFGGSEMSNSPDTGNCVPNASGSGKSCAGTSLGGFGQSCSSDAQCTPSCCADHLEEQMFPVDTLGSSYVAVRLAPRGKEKDAWRILAVEDGTTVTVSPSQGAALPMLNKGQWKEFQSNQDFVIEANHPVLVAQYMASSYATITTEGATCNVGGSATQCLTKYNYTADCLDGGFSGYCAPIGDPSLILTAATSQFLDDYIFLVPAQYKINYINIAMPQGATAKIDGSLIAASTFKAVTGSQWQVARLPVKDGPHRLQLSAKGGLTVYGYDKDVSYGYTGGAGLAVGGQP